MKDEDKTKEQLINELQELRGQIVERKESNAQYKHMEEALQTSEEKYRAIVEAFDGLIYVCSQDYRIEFMNERFIERTCYDPTGELCYKALHDLDSICPWCVNERVFRGETVRWEVQSPKDSRWYYVVNTPIYHPDGSISKQAMIQDITDHKKAKEALQKAHDTLEQRVEERTRELAKLNKDLQSEILERKRSEEALRESKRKFHAIFDQTFQFIGLMTPDGTLLKANRTSLEFIMAEESDVLGKPFWETPWWTHSPELQERLRHAVKAVAKGGFIRFEVTHPTADGKLSDFDFSIKPIKDEAGNTVLLIPESHNITDRKRAEEALRQSEQRYRTLVETMNEGLAVQDKNGLTTYVNEKFCEMSGFSRDEMIGRSARDFLDVFDKTNQSIVKKQMARRRKGERESYELSWTRKDGRKVSAIVSAVPILDSNGNFKGAFAVVTDISERKWAEDLLRIQRDLGIALSATSDMTETFRRLLEAIFQVDGIDCGGVYLVDRLTEELYLVSHKGLPRQFVESASYFDADSPQVRLVMAGEPVYGLYSELFPASDEVRQSEGLHAIAIIPITHEEQVVGALNLASHTCNEIPMSARNAFEAIAALIGGVIARIRVQEALQESEERYRSVFENTSSATMIVEEDMTISMANTEFENLSGYSKEQIEGKMRWTEFVIKEDLEAMKEHHAKRRVNERGAPTEYEFRFKDKQGNIKDIFSKAGMIPGTKRSVASLMDITPRMRAEKALQKSEEELRFLSSRLLTIQEEERKRIARDLHDGIGQFLNFLIIGMTNALENINERAARQASESLQALIPMIKNVIEEVRRSYTDLRPPMIDNLGILATIGWFCREFEETCPGIRIEKQVDIEESEFSDMLKITIFRILQEALSNIVKHSKANLVRLSLRKTEDTKELAIEDNGSGFDPKDLLSREDSRKGIGLTSMRERTELSGGSFAIESIRGKGTTIRVSWPCKA